MLYSVDDLSLGTGLQVNSYAGTQLYNNQFFDYLSEQLPRKIKDMFKWCELVYYNSPVIVNCLRKLANYPITDFSYETQSEKIKRNTEKFLIEQIDIKSHLINTGLDYYIYGNCFRSMYFPFTRNLVCKKCKNIVNVADAKYKLTKGKFVLTCGECKSIGIAEVKDIRTKDLSNVKIISWNPYHIDLLANPITNDIFYYYSIPAIVKTGVINNDPGMINTLPQIFIDAVAQNKKVKFKGNIIHLKTPFLSGGDPGWGISPLAPTLKLYMHMAVLRKAVEAIGMEHIVPQRILFPQGNTNDPTIMTAMNTWKKQIQLSINRWRRDPNYIMLAPYPTGVANIGSQGRALMPTQELKQTEEEILRALDVPAEFIMGTTNINNSTVSLRMLENQLTPYIDQMTNYVNWIIDMTNAEYDLDLCHVKFTSFKLVDDIMKINVLTQLAASGGGVSKTTVQETLGLEPDKEREQVIKEMVDNAEDQKKIEQSIKKIQSNIAEQSIQEEQAQADGNIPQYNQQKMIAQAQQQAQQLMTVPYEQRKSIMAQLQNEDYIMWSLVRAQLETLHAAQKTQNAEPNQGPQQ